ncbi:MAG: type II toxin-antitoxin system RelE/ParE family toxin [Candidatus Methylomirabilales bacterium]
MTSYEVVLRPSAQRDLRKLPQAVEEQVIRALDILRSQPRPVGVKKLAGGTNEWRLRVGDYRILYEINDKKRYVRVFRIAHRRDAYR